MYALHEALAREHQRELQRYVRPDERSGRRNADRRYRHVGAHQRHQRGRR